MKRSQFLLKSASIKFTTLTSLESRLIIFLCVKCHFIFVNFYTTREGNY